MNTSTATFSDISAEISESQTESTNTGTEPLTFEVQSIVAEKRSAPEEKTIFKKYSIEDR